MLSLLDFQSLVVTTAAVIMVLSAPGQNYMALQGKINVLIFDV